MDDAYKDTYSEALKVIQDGFMTHMRTKWCWNMNPHIETLYLWPSFGGKYIYITIPYMEHMGDGS